MGIKPFICTYMLCDRSFSTKANLKKHLNDHFQRDKVNENVNQKTNDEINKNTNNIEEEESFSFERNLINKIYKK